MGEYESSATTELRRQVRREVPFPEEPPEIMWHSRRCTAVAKSTGKRCRAWQVGEGEVCLAHGTDERRREHRRIRAEVTQAIIEYEATVESLVRQRILTEGVMLRSSWDR